MYVKILWVALNEHTGTCWRSASFSQATSAGSSCKSSLLPLSYAEETLSGHGRKQKVYTSQVKDGELFQRHFQPQSLFYVTRRHFLTGLGAWELDCDPAVRRWGLGPRGALRCSPQRQLLNSEAVTLSGDAPYTASQADSSYVSVYTTTTISSPQSQHIYFNHDSLWKRHNYPSRRDTLGDRWVGGWRDRCSEID